MRDFLLGDRVEINPNVHCGRRAVGGRLCTVIAKHDTTKGTVLSLSDGSHVHITVLEQDVTYVRHGGTSVRIGDTIHEGSELLWTLLFWGCVVFLPGLFGVLSARVAFDAVEASTLPGFWATPMAILAGIVAALATAGGILALAACIDTPQAGDRDE